jgi:hypothetical protein
LLHDTARLAFEQPFTKDEIKITVFGSNAAGSLGPDGFSLQFFSIFGI